MLQGLLNRKPKTWVNFQCIEPDCEGSSLPLMLTSGWCFSPLPLSISRISCVFRPFLSLSKSVRIIWESFRRPTLSSGTYRLGEGEEMNVTHEIIARHHHCSVE